MVDLKRTASLIYDKLHVMSFKDKKKVIEHIITQKECDEFLLGFLTRYYSQKSIETNKNLMKVIENLNNDTPVASSEKKTETPKKKVTPPETQEDDDIDIEDDEEQQVEASEPQKDEPEEEGDEEEEEEEVEIEMDDDEEEEIVFE